MTCRSARLRRISRESSLRPSAAARSDSTSWTRGACTQIYEATGLNAQLVGTGIGGLYDSTGNIVLLVQYPLSGGAPSSLPVLAVSTRGACGATQQLGTAGMAAAYYDTSGFDRAVVLIGESPPMGTAPASVRLALVNALAGNQLLYLADFNTPLDLTSAESRVVTY